MTAIGVDMVTYYGDKDWRAEHRDHFDAWLQGEFQTGYHVTRIELIGEGVGAEVTYVKDKVVDDELAWHFEIRAWHTGPPPPCCLRVIEERP